MPRFLSVLCSLLGFPPFRLWFALWSFLLLGLFLRAGLGGVWPFCPASLGWFWVARLVFLGWLGCFGLSLGSSGGWLVGSLGLCSLVLWPRSPLSSVFFSCFSSPAFSPVCLRCLLPCLASLPFLPPPLPPSPPSSFSPFLYPV